MSDSEIKFRIMFRDPIYPVILIAEDDIWPAQNIDELGSLCYVSEPPKGQDFIKVIDSTGEEFIYYPEQVMLTPGINKRKWSKKRFIELFDNSEIAKEKNLKYSQKSLSNKKLSVVVTEICKVLRHIGIGSDLTPPPTPPDIRIAYPAVRLVKTGNHKTIACRALFKQNATDISATAAICR